MHIRTPVPLLIVLAAVLLFDARGQQSNEEMIARAGTVYISEQEFLERFELLPAFGRHKKAQLESAKLELLYSMIAEKLLAQEAEGRGMDREPGFAAGFEEIKKLLARDELYREEVINKVTVPDHELRQGIDRAVRLMEIRFLYFSDAADARFVRGRLRQAGDLARIHIDSTYHAIRDTATLIWGDADPRMEDAVYALKPGEVSPVIEAGGGYYIVTCTGVRRNEFTMGMTPDVLRDRVASTLRRRKERARLDQFVQDVLRDKTGYAVPGSFRKLASALARAYQDGDRDSIAYFTPSRVEAVRSALASSLEDTLAVAGDRIWRVGDGIARLAQRGLGIRRNALRSLPYQLNSEMKLLVQQELLAREALHRRLDTLSEVSRQLRMWADAFLAGAIKDSLRSRVAVADSEVWAYLAIHDTSVAVPQVQIRELKTASLEDMREALAELERGTTFDGVIRQWSVDRQEKERGGLSGFFAVSARQPIGTLAASMEVGHRYGPVAVPGGYSYFELVAKRSGNPPGDTSAALRIAQAKESLLAMKQRRALTLHIAGLGKTLGFDVYADRLRMLNGTPIPMMTFRILGFGGRIPAVPFVDPQLDWLDVEGAERVPVP